MGALFLSAAAAKSLSPSLEERCWSSEVDARPMRLAALSVEEAIVGLIRERGESFTAGLALGFAAAEPGEERGALLQTMKRGEERPAWRAVDGSMGSITDFLKE